MLHQDGSNATCQLSGPHRRRVAALRAEQQQLATLTVRRHGPGSRLVPACDRRASADPDGGASHSGQQRHRRRHADECDPRWWPGQSGVVFIYLHADYVEAS